MNVVRIEFQTEGFQDILTSDGVHQLIESQTEAIASRANGNNARGGDGFASDVWIGTRAGRWIGTVTTTDEKSRIAEAEDKALSRAVRG